MEDTLKIPTQTLPEGWREIGAKEFNISESMVEKIVYGLKENVEVFAFMLSLAEKETERVKEKKAQLKKRIQALTK